MSMTLLFNLLWLTLAITARFIRSAIAKACLGVPVPPPNWNNAALLHFRNSGMDFARPIQYALSRETKCSCHTRKGRRNANRTGRSRNIHSWLVDPEEYFDLQRRCVEEEVLEMSLRNVCENDSSPAADSSDDGDTTLYSLDSRMLDFSIYANSFSPTSNLSKAVVMSPKLRPTKNMKEVSLTALTAASERVSEILRENRRRLDSGEDSDAFRREARRKRAQELSAVRRHHSYIY